LILIAAVVVGALATYALFNYVNGVEDKAYEGARRVQVLVVKQTIPKSTDGDTAIREKFIAADDIPQEFLPSTAITDPTLISGKVALIDLVPGQVLVDGMFVNQDVAFVTVAERIPVDRVAVTVQVDQVRGVAGLLVPGDKVNLIVLPPDQTFFTDVDPNAATTEDDTTTSSTSEGEPTAAFSRFLYQNVEILAIGQQAAAEPGSGQAPTVVSSGLITFSVPPEAAQRIAIAAASSALYLTLAPKNYQPVDLAPVTGENFFDTGRLTPYPNGG